MAILPFIPENQVFTKLLRAYTHLVVDKDKEPPVLNYVPDAREYFTALESILKVVCDGEAKSFAFQRMRYLEAKWNMYKLLNEQKENADGKVTFFCEY